MGGVKKESGQALARLPAVLLPWYDENRRVLPWREEVTPYRTWVSEVMLQQTRVQAALPYFLRFMEAAPDIPALAALPEGQLMRLWQGLGYYSRARSLQKAARQVVEQYGGCLPQTYSELTALPGIGDYTAGAILSIAFGQPVPAVDGNVLRIAARLTGCGDNVLLPQTRQRFRDALAAVMPPHRPGDFNQALMDLGAGVCLPGQPACDVCPARELCAALAAGRQRELPVREKNTAKPTEQLTVFVLTRPDGAAALRQRPQKGLLAGLWEFPHVPGTLDEQAAAHQLAEWGLRVTEWRRCIHAVHQFTHRRWDMAGWVLAVEGDGQGDWLWADAAAREEKAIPSAFRAFMKALE